VARSRKQGIRRSVEQLLVPALVARGFEHLPATDDAQLSPFGRFRRRTERGFELIEIPFNKNRTSHFCLHFARFTGTPAPSWAGNLAPDDRCVWHIVPNYQLFRRPLIFRYRFGVRKYAREGITEAEYDAAVMAAVESLPLVERYFSKGKTTLAMHKYPDGLRDNLGYVGLCITVVLGSVYAAIWTVGFLVRHL
jgi:hypothetical protein